MLTRCPHCTTTFRVKPEQLKARLGRVRCGQCQTVFNALDSLVEEVPVVPVVPMMPMAAEVSEESEVLVAPGATADGPAQAFPAQEATAPQSAHQVETMREAPELTAPADEESPPTADLPDRSETEALPIAVAEEIPPPVVPEPEQEKSAVSAGEPAAPDLDAEPEPVLAVAEEMAPEAYSEATPDATSEDSSPAKTADAEAEALDFTIAESLTPAAIATPPAPQAAATETPASSDAPTTQSVAEPEPASPQAPRPPRRWPWAVLATLASLMLIGQALFYYRVDMAVFAPALKPLLKAACEPLGCEVPRPRKVDLLDIESSDLHPGKTKGRLELVAVLKNKAPYSQELPVLELTLTDTADRPLITKALQPVDYLPPGRKPTAGFPAKGEINVNLTLDAGDVPASGYRLYLYYP